MRYAEIINNDVLNGNGIRVSLFLTGCDHNCKGCFNSLAKSYKVGKLFTLETEHHLYKLLSRPYIKGLSLLGGDPLAEGNVKEVIALMSRIKYLFPEKDIWLWTGDSFDDIPKQVIELSDYIVDGEFEEGLKDLRLTFRGSCNQKIYHKGVDVTHDYSI